MTDVTGKNLFGKSYGAVYLDPDWEFRLRSAAGQEKSPQKHYDCTTTEEIGNFLKDLLEFSCAPNAVMIMFCTWPMMARGDCHQVMRTAGFQPKTGGSWGKMSGLATICMGTGYIYRGADEPWLMGTRGEPKGLVSDQRNLLLDPALHLDYLARRGVLDGDLVLDLRREHSRKPDLMIEAIERQFEGPYLDVFARNDHPGWDVWGDEVGKFPESVAEPETTLHISV